MKKKSGKIIYKSSIFNINEDFYKGQKIVKIDSPNWVNILPITQNNEILMIRQYRHGTENVIIETPGGIIDPKDRSPLDAAKRELLEETGFKSESWEQMGWVYANPAYQNNKCYFFIAKNIEQKGLPSLDFDEHIIESFFVPLKNALDMLKTGEINHSIIYAVLSNYFIKNNFINF